MRFINSWRERTRLRQVSVLRMAAIVLSTTPYLAALARRRRLQLIPSIAAGAAAAAPSFACLSRPRIVSERLA